MSFALQIDVGFGDAVTPGPQTVASHLSGRLPGLSCGSIRFTVIAEKYQAMVMLGQANSRMKDFFDLAVIAAHGTGRRHAGGSHCHHLCPTPDRLAHQTALRTDQTVQRRRRKAAPVAGAS